MSTVEVVGIVVGCIVWMRVCNALATGDFQRAVAKWIIRRERKRKRRAL